MGSAPSVSNFASYSGVLTVIVRCGAALTFGVGSGTDGAPGVLELLACAGVALAAGEGVEPDCWFGRGGTGEK